MKDIKFRVDEELHQQLQDLSAREGESMSTVVRRIVRRELQPKGRDVEASRAHEGTGRVR